MVFGNSVFRGGVFRSSAFRNCHATLSVQELHLDALLTFRRSPRKRADAVDGATAAPDNPAHIAGRAADFNGKTLSTLT